MVVNYHHKLRLRHMRQRKARTLLSIYLYIYLSIYLSIRKFLTLGDCVVQV